MPGDGRDGYQGWSIDSSLRDVFPSDCYPLHRCVHGQSTHGNMCSTLMKARSCSSMAEALIKVPLAVLVTEFGPAALIAWQGVLLFPQT